MLLVCTISFTTAVNRGRSMNELIAKNLEKASRKSGRNSALDALKTHKEKKEGSGKPRRSLEEIEEDVIEKVQEKRNPFGSSRSDKFKLLNKRRSGSIVGSSSTEEETGNDELEESGDQEVLEEGEGVPAAEVAPAKKIKPPFHYSIPQQVMNVATIEGWRQTKIYMIIGMFLFIGGVISISYYRSRNKMLLPGKLM